MNNKRCVFITEANLAHDGRTMELIDVVNNVCATTVVCFESDYNIIGDNFVEVKKASGFLRRIRSSARLTKAASRLPCDILFVDNSKACVDAYLLLLKYNNKPAVLDTRELYLKGEKRSRLMKIICCFERKIIKRADFIIAANESRASYMKEYYKLANKPAVFENIRKITDNPQQINDLDKFIQKSDKVLSYTGGLIKDRELPILSALQNLKPEYKLVIAGRGTNEEYTAFKTALEKNGVSDRVLYLGELNRGQLRYLIQNSYIGFVYYEGKNMNEKYCASGKIYEYMFEGIPFASPMLESHVDLEKKYHVCACNDDLSVAVTCIDNDYQHYKENVSLYMKNISEEINRNKLMQSLKQFVYH